MSNLSDEKIDSTYLNKKHLRNNEPNGESTNKSSFIPKPMTFQLPKPSFRRLITDFTPELDINKDCSYPNDTQPPNPQIVKQPTPTKPVIDVIATAYKKKQNFFFIYKNTPLKFTFDILLNFTNSTVMEIYKFIDETTLNEYKLNVSHLMIAVKLNIAAGDDSSELMSKVAVIKEINTNTVYIAFRNLYQFEFCSIPVSENEIIVYQVTFDEAKELLLNGKIAPKKIDINEAIAQLRNPKRLTLNEVTDRYQELMNLRIEVPLEKKKYDDRLIAKEKEKKHLYQRYTGSEYYKYLKSLQEQKSCIIKDNQDLSTDVTFLESQIHDYQVETSTKKKQLEIEREKNIELNEKLLESKSILEAKALEELTLKNEIMKLKEELDKMQSLGISESTSSVDNQNREVVVIDGEDFEIQENGIKANIGQQDESYQKLVRLKEEYEAYLCVVCLEKKRDCLYSECNHISCCLNCIKTKIKKKNGSTGFKKGIAFIKGSFICPSCKKESKQIRKINID